MENIFSTEQELFEIAQQCSCFEHVISAMGYGYSLVNVSPKTYLRKCTECVNWLGGSCDIYSKFKYRDIIKLDR